MTSFAELFGGNTISPTQLSYTSFEIDESIELQWPLNADPSANFAAQKIGVVAIDAGLEIAVPPANQVSVGVDIMFINDGAQTFTVTDADGNTLGSVASGEAWYFWTTDNSSTAGSWSSVEFGAGTSSADAAALAGAGLQAVLTTLNQNLSVTSLVIDYTPSAADRATVLLSTGGVVTYTPANPATLGDGWFVYVINGGSGALTWDGNGALVDGEATKTINPDESAIFFSDGTNFWTLGYGRAITSTVTAATINVAGSASPVTLSAAQAAAQVQDYTGAITGNIVVNYGAGVGYWFVRNNTSGAFTLTLRVNGSDTGAVISQGSYSVIRSNGSNIVIALTAAAGTVTSVDGTADFTGVPITTTGTIGLSTTGVVAASYGSASKTLTATVDNKGRLSAMAAPDIAITTPQVTDLAAVLAALLPAGVIMPYGGSAAPSGYLLCDGSAVSRATYSALFAVIGITYGPGDGINTFNVPDLGGRVPYGRDTAGRISSAFTNSNTLGTAGGTQSHAHSGAVAMDGPNQLATVEAASINPVNVASGTHTHANITTATTSTVPPGLIVNYIIKT